METVLRFLFVLGCLPIGIAVMVMILLSPKPHTWLDHMQGAARISVVAGALFCLAAIASGSSPHPFSVAVVLGMAFLICVHAKDVYAKARELERQKKATT